jgi:hypothetical protein
VIFDPGAFLLSRRGWWPDDRFGLTVVARHAWTAFLAGTVALEAYGLKHPERIPPLSAWARWMFRVETALGRVAFVVGWAWLSKWFVPHVVGRRGPLDRMV